jgi:CheY-like chemotaxis protein
MNAIRTEPQRARVRVLVVDDDPDTQLIISKVLEHAGCDAEVAADGLSALAAIRRQRPHAVILDFAMPMLSGPDVLAALKADRETRDIPIIACTAAVAAPADVPALLELGFTEVLLKPVEPEMLRAAVGRVCKLAQQ